MTNNRKIEPKIEQKIEPMKVSNNRDNLVDSLKDYSMIDIPKDVVKNYVKDIRTQVAMAKTCKTYFNLFQSSLSIPKQALHYAAFGKQSELDGLLVTYPELALYRGMVVDLCGRNIYGTVYRIALGAKDWSPQPAHFKEMAEMIEYRMMTSLPDGEKEILLQRAEQFPVGWEWQKKKREEEDSSALKTVFAEIAKANTKYQCDVAINNFITYLKSQNEVKTGYHFNDKLLVEAYALYETYYNDFLRDNRVSGKRQKTAIEVIGSIQSRMTACMKLAYCLMKSNDVAEGKNFLARELIDDTGFFTNGLGSSFFIYNGARQYFLDLTISSFASNVFTTYFEKKNQTAPHLNKLSVENRNYMLAEISVYRGH